MLATLRAAALAVLSTAILTGSLLAAELPDVSIIPADLTTPPLIDAAPAPGLRVRATTPGWDSTAVYHTLYLPTNWRANARYPVLFEYGGNGGFRGAYGDSCDGTVEECDLGYGLSGGRDYIWVALPCVETRHGTKSNARVWWGDADETVRYCIATAHDVCAEFGGDSTNLILCGFSRGAIACNYIGLRNDAIARLWRAFLCHSHYDGVRTWPYPDSDRDAAVRRLQRLAGRPQFISSEGSLAATREFIGSSGAQAPFTFADLPYRNHTDAWALRDCDLRRHARAWLAAFAPR